MSGITSALLLSLLFCFCNCHGIDDLTTVLSCPETPPQVWSFYMYIVLGQRDRALHIKWGCTPPWIQVLYRSLPPLKNEVHDAELLIHTCTRHYLQEPFDVYLVDISNYKFVSVIPACVTNYDTECIGSVKDKPDAESKFKLYLLSNDKLALQANNDKYLSRIA